MCTNVSEHSQPQKKTTKIIRKLGHLSSLQEHGRFVSKPDFLEDLLLDNKIDLSYYRLITVMLRHSAFFHIKSSYLRNRFDPRTLKKYIQKAIDDNIIYVEKDGCKNVYHTNPIHLWKFTEAQYYTPEEHIYGNVQDDSAQIDERGGEHGVGEHGVGEHGVGQHGLNQTKANQTKGNQTKLKKGRATDDKPSEATPPKRKNRYSFNEADMALAEYFKKGVNKYHSHIAEKHINIAQWANEARLIVNHYKTDHGTVAQVFKFGFSDVFWRKQMQSIMAMRKKRDGISKFDRLISESGIAIQ